MAHLRIEIMMDSDIPVEWLNEKHFKDYAEDLMVSYQTEAVVIRCVRDTMVTCDHNYTEEEAGGIENLLNRYEMRHG